MAFVDGATAVEWALTLQRALAAIAWAEGLTNLSFDVGTRQVAQVVSQGSRALVSARVRSGLALQRALHRG